MNQGCHLIDVSGAREKAEGISLVSLPGTEWTGWCSYSINVNVWALLREWQQKHLLHWPAVYSLAFTPFTVTVPDGVLQETDILFNLNVVWTECSTSNNEVRHEGSTFRRWCHSTGKISIYKQHICQWKYCIYNHIWNNILLNMGWYIRNKRLKSSASVFRLNVWREHNILYWKHIMVFLLFARVNPSDPAYRK